MSRPPDPREVRLAQLVERAAAERAALAESLAPIVRLDDAVAKLRSFGLGAHGAWVGTSMAVSALVLLLPAGRFPVVRGAVALYQLGTSVRRLFTRR